MSQRMGRMAKREPEKSLIDTPVLLAMIGLLLLVSCVPSRLRAEKNGGPLERESSGAAGPRLDVEGKDVPQGFRVERVARADTPTSLAFTPDGSMLVTTQPGRLLLWDGESMTTVLDLVARTCSRTEQGLLGVVLDPSFTRNSSVYLYYTAVRGGDCVNRVSRFVLEEDGVDPGTEFVLLDNIPSVSGNHNGGDLEIGKDGYLYVSVGDGGCDYDGDGCAGSNDAARDGNVLVGKILRITLDGGIPPDNPLVGPNSARCALVGQIESQKVCQETFASGLRNPFRMAFDPESPGVKFLINEPGQDAWEEINEGKAGADYGWNVREGGCVNGRPRDCADPEGGLTDPVFAYAHSEESECDVITGGAFVPSGIWPAPYDGSYLFGDFACGGIFRLSAQGAEPRKADLFLADDPGIVHLLFGPYESTQALYFTTYDNGGEIRRVVYSG